METNFFVGYGLYRKTFNVPPEWLENGKRVSIEFEGSFIETEVFVNGEAVGTHLGGYTGFTFDLSLIHISIHRCCDRAPSQAQPHRPAP